MTIQWPAERTFEQQKQLGNHSIDPKEELRRLLKALPTVLPDSFNDVVKWIAQQDGDICELEKRIGKVRDELELLEFHESLNLLMTLACAESLAITPTLQSWQKVRKFTSHSWALEHWLSDAMLVCATDSANKREAYIKLAKEIFHALDKYQLKSQFERNNNERDQSQLAWDETSKKLEEIWWGLRHFPSMNYQEEFPLFQVFEALDFGGYLAAISKSKNPCLVRSTFWAIGVFNKFRLWEKLSISAPLAFNADGTWNNSITMPLLLVIARDQLLQISSHNSNLDGSDAEMERARHEIADFTEIIVGILDGREDAFPLFARWTTWLMRQLLMKSTKDIDDIRSSAFVNASLIEAIGRKLEGKTVNCESPPDAPPWEPWCYRAVLASHADSGFMESPDFIDFLDEWNLNLDDWAGEKGKKLRERAHLIVTMSKEIPGQAAHLLAYPVAQSKSPVETWIELWDATHTLREIVEFGDADALASDEYQVRNEAGKLVFLVFCMGLSILDQCISQCLTSDSPQARGLATLHESLALSVREMLEIDDTLNREIWLQAVQHLAVRRLIWEDKSLEDGNNGRFPVFLPEDRPTFDDYLNAAKNDVMELLAVLQSALINESDCQLLRDKMDAVSIDLTEVVETAKRLNGISSRKYPIDEEQLRLLLLRDGVGPS